MSKPDKISLVGHVTVKGRTVYTQRIQFTASGWVIATDLLGDRHLFRRDRVLSIRIKKDAEFNLT